MHGVGGGFIGACGRVKGAGVNGAGAAPLLRLSHAAKDC